MAISEDLFRDIFRRWPSGAAVVTALADGRPHGMVIGSLCSLSSTPPLLMFSAGVTSRTHAVVAGAGAFAISILADEQSALFERFAGFDRQHDDDRFADLATATAITGAPYFPDGLAWADCRVVDRHPGATYTIFVGELVAAGLGAAAEASPLIYFRRQRRQLAG